MVVRVVVRRLLPFCLAATCGFVFVYFLKTIPSTPPAVTNEVQKGGSGSSSGDYGSGHTDSLESSPGKGKLFILAKPKAMYTRSARENNIQGTVRVRVTLLASGQVGAVTPITELPDGLTEQAVAAARQIKFEPKTIKGVPVTTIVTFEYSFTIY